MENRIKCRVGTMQTRNRHEREHEEQPYRARAQGAALASETLWNRFNKQQYQEQLQ